MCRKGLSRNDAEYLVNYDLAFVALSMSLVDEIDGIILGSSRPHLTWKGYLDNI